MRTWLLLLVPIALVGCAKKHAPLSSDGVAKAFAEAVSAGDTAKAADLFDYNSVAREENGDWDTFPLSQRSLVINKMKQDKAVELASAFPKGAKVTVSPAGGQGAFALSVDGKAKGTMQMRQVGEGWKILAIQ